MRFYRVLFMPRNRAGFWYSRRLKKEAINSYLIDNFPDFMINIEAISFRLTNISKRKRRYKLIFRVSVRQTRVRSVIRDRSKITMMLRFLEFRPS